MTSAVIHPAPRISVISIFFNASAYLAEAIESVLAQDFANFELLLVDDGSEDDGPDIAKSYARREPDRVRYLQHEDNGNHGMSATRNLGLRAARGEFVAFIDADDRWRGAKLREQLAVLEQHPDVSAVSGSVNYWASHDGGADRIVMTGHALNRPVAPPEALLSLYPLGKAAPPCPSDMLLRKSTVDAVGGFEPTFTGALQLYEDQAFLAKLHLNATVYFSNTVWLDYRLHDQSCVSQVTRAGRYDEVRQHYLKWLGSYLETNRHRSNSKISVALFRAHLPYRYPLLVEFRRRIGRIVRKLSHQ
jgi:glycosyltransferase involved in cell wall biosynthesis